MWFLWRYSWYPRFLCFLLGHRAPVYQLNYCFCCLRPIEEPWDR